MSGRNAVVRVVVTVVLAGAAFGGDVRGAQPTPGLIGRYFQLDFSVTSLDQVDFAAAANDTVTDLQINFLPTGDEFRPGLTGYLDHFAVEWTGLILVDQADDITFTTHGDDASRLYIDGALVAETDFSKAMFEGVGTAGLSAGLHGFRMEYMEIEGWTNCTAAWDIGAPQQIIPPEAFFTPEPATLTLLALAGLAALRRRRGSVG